MLKLRGWVELHRNDLVFFRCLEKAAMMPWLEFKPEEQVCELGCFNGADARKISERYGCRVYGMDADQNAIRVAHSFNKTKGTHFQVALAESLPFASESFDKMYGISVLEHFSNGQGALGEAYRCLKPGGILVLTTDSFALGEVWQGTQDIHKEKFVVHRYYTQSELVKDMQSAGFEVLGAEPILRHWLAGFLFELNVRFRVVKHVASLLLPLLRWLEWVNRSQGAGYMQMVCATKPTSAKGQPTERGRENETGGAKAG